MEIVHEGEVESTEAVDGVHLKLLAGGSEANVQQFTIEPGATVPEHDHPHEQVGYVIEGALEFTVDGETHRAETGDSFVIPGGEPHSAENAADVPVVGFDVFAPPRENPDWQD